MVEECCVKCKSKDFMTIGVIEGTLLVCANCVDSCTIMIGGQLHVKEGFSVVHGY